MYPFIEIFEMKIQTYFLVMIFVFSLSLILVYEKSKKYSFHKQFLLDLTLILASSGFVFARLTHVFFENFLYYYLNPMEVLKFWNGGFVFLGGFLGAFLSGYIFVLLKKKKELVLELMDFYAPLLALVYSLGRGGCFLAGCCYGKYCELVWAVQGRHPTQLYALAWDGFLFLILNHLEKEKTRPKAWSKGMLFSVWMIGHGAGRFWQEFYRDDFRGPIFLFSLSGWVSLCLILFGVFTFFRFQKSKV